MYIPLTYKPGTMKARQHTKITDVAFLDTNRVRFQADNNRLATIPPYSLTSISEIQGKCRAIWGQRITSTNNVNCYFFGTHSHLYVEINDVRYNITPLKTTGTTLPTDPLEITSGDKTVVVNHTAHGKADGDRIDMSGLVGTINGVPAADFNKEHVITYINANKYSIEVATSPSSSDSTAGGAAVLIKGQIDPGNEVQVDSSGLGAGDFGGGLFGAGGSSTTGLQDYPRIWSFAAFGNNVVMCPGDRTAGDGQKLYYWDGDTDVAPVVIPNAPTDCNWVAVINNSIVALCGRTIKIAALGELTTWSGLLYREKTFERIDIAHSCFTSGEKDALVHHGNGVIILRYTGDSNIWDLADLFEGDGVVSPYSTARLNEMTIWRARKAFYSYDGNVVRMIQNNMNQEWINANANDAVAWHGFAVTDIENQEIYYYFATGSDQEPGDYVLYSPRNNGDFTLGRMSRTAGQRPNIFNNTFYMADSTGEVYRHFTKGATTFDWFAETAPFCVNMGDQRFMIDMIRPDASQSGNVTLEIYSMEFPTSTPVLMATRTITPTTPLVSVRVAGRYVKFRFSGSSEMTLGEYAVNIRPLGKMQGKVV